MAEFTPLEVSALIKMLGPTFKDAFIPLGLSCILPYHQIKVDEPLLRATAEIGSQLSMSSNSMVWNYAVLLKNSVQSWVAHQLFGIPLAKAQRWCKLKKLNICMVFMYFLKRMLLWLGNSTLIILMPFVYAFLQGTSWCIRHLM